MGGVGGAWGVWGLGSILLLCPFSSPSLSLFFFVENNKKKLPPSVNCRSGSAPPLGENVDRFGEA